MGITGLLRLLKPVTKSCHISLYNQKTIAIDGYAWLHKAVYSCCMELALGEESDKWIKYCLNMIDMLDSNGIIVYMVFDGANLPAKSNTENSRAKKRSDALAAGLVHLQSDRKEDHEKARSFFSQAVDVTPRMAGQLIKVIREIRPKVMLFCSKLLWRTSTGGFMYLNMRIQFARRFCAL
jgi:exonuclease 1